MKKHTLSVKERQVTIKIFKRVIKKLKSKTTFFICNGINNLLITNEFTFGEYDTAMEYLKSEKPTKLFNKEFYVESMEFYNKIQTTENPLWWDFDYKMRIQFLEYLITKLKQ